MSDTRLRDIERAASTGDPQARAALLTARMRAGSLDRSMVELAAYCGSQEARVALGWVWPPRGERSFLEWLRGLARFGDECEMRAAAAACRWALPLFQRDHWESSENHEPCNLPPAEAERACPIIRSALLAVEAAEDYIRDPSDEAAVLRCARYCDEDDLGRSGGESIGVPAWAAVLCSGVLRVSGYDDQIMRANPLAAINIAGADYDDDKIRRAVECALVSWALSPIEAPR